MEFYLPEFYLQDICPQDVTVHIKHFIQPDFVSTQYNLHGSSVGRACSEIILSVWLMQVRVLPTDHQNFLLYFSKCWGVKFLRADFLFGIMGRFPTCRIPAGKIPTSRFPRADFHGQISGVLIFCGQNSCMQNSYRYNSKQVKILKANFLRSKFPRAEIQMVKFLPPIHARRTEMTIQYKNF